MDKRDTSQVHKVMSNNLHGVWKRKMLYQAGSEKTGKRKNCEGGCYVCELSIMFANRHK